MFREWRSDNGGLRIMEPRKDSGIFHSQFSLFSAIRYPTPTSVNRYSRFGRIFLDLAADICHIDAQDLVCHRRLAVPKAL